MPNAVSHKQEAEINHQTREEWRRNVRPWNTVEGGHEDVGDGEVEEEVVGDAPHGAVRQDDPQDHCVPHDCNHNNH